MLVFVTQILLIFSLGGMVFLLVHKMPLLSSIENIKTPLPQDKKTLKKTKNFLKERAKLLSPALKGVKHKALRAVQRKKQEPEGKAEQIEQNRDYWDKVSE